MRIEFKSTLFSLLCAGGLLSACTTPTANMELDLADKALKAALAKKANDCAKESYQAAEATLEQARALAEEGKIDEAKRKAGEAEHLAKQAGAASTPGCDEPKVVEAEPEPEADASASTSAAMNMSLEGALQTIYFDYNEASIREDSKEVLSKVASILRESGGDKVEIEGHCDIRGSTEYNLHLGERRARSVKKYLVAQGVNPEQVRIISYGEERPSDFGASEDAHSANRRAELKKL